MSMWNLDQLGSSRGVSTETALFLLVFTYWLWYLGMFQSVKAHEFVAEAGVTIHISTPQISSESGGLVPIVTQTTGLPGHSIAYRAAPFCHNRVEPMQRTSRGPK